MSIRYEWIKRKSNESLASYDKRINSMPSFHAGYAYFGADAYDSIHHIYGLYIIWNGEVNNFLFEKLNEYGYTLKCSPSEAELLFCSQVARQVFIKLVSNDGILRVAWYTMPCNGKQFVVSYTGLCVNKPDMLCFSVLDNDNSENFCENKKTADTHFVSSAIFNPRISSSAIAYTSFVRGSFNVSSFLKGSYSVGSFNIGSFFIGANFTGSFGISSYNISSFNLQNFSLGSFNVTSFNVGSFNTQSFSLSSFSVKNFSIGSYYSGSFAGRINNLGSHTGFLTEAIYSENPKHLKEDLSDKDIEYIMHEVYGIGCLGYGLNLI